MKTLANMIKNTIIFYVIAIIVNYIVNSLVDIIVDFVFFNDLPKKERDSGNYDHGFVHALKLKLYFGILIFCACVFSYTIIKIDGRPTSMHEYNAYISTVRADLADAQAKKKYCEKQPEMTCEYDSDIRYISNYKELLATYTSDVMYKDASKLYLFLFILNFLFIFICYAVRLINERILLLADCYKESCKTTN